MVKYIKFQTVYEAVGSQGEMIEDKLMFMPIDNIAYVEFIKNGDLYVKIGLKQDILNHSSFIVERSSIETIDEERVIDLIKGDKKENKSEESEKFKDQKEILACKMIEEEERKAKVDAAIKAAQKWKEGQNKTAKERIVEMAKEKFPSMNEATIKSIYDTIEVFLKAIDK